VKKPLHLACSVEGFSIKLRWKGLTIFIHSPELSMDDSGCDGLRGDVT
jgi:hypothetical protein